MELDDFFMGLAIEEAEKGYSQAEVPVGAVVVGPDGEILSRAHNKPIISNDPTAHAEILAIRSASIRSAITGCLEPLCMSRLSPVRCVLGRCLTLECGAWFSARATRGAGRLEACWI